MGIIDKENAMNLALGIDASDVSGEGNSLLALLGGVADSKKELESLRAVYQKFADDLKAIHDKANREIMELQSAQVHASSEEEIARIQESMAIVRNGEEENIEALRNKMLELPESWNVVWSVIGQLTATSTKDLITTLREEIEKLSQAGKLTASAKKELLEKLSNVTVPKQEEGAFKKLGGLMSDLFKSMGAGAEMTQDKWKKLGNAIGECSTIASKSLSGISDVGGAFGMSKESQATFDQVSGLVSGMGDMAKGIASGDISSIISGGVGMITNATKLFDFKTKKADKEIKKHAENLKKLKDQYEDLNREADKALGTEEYQKQLEQIKNLEQQQIEVQGQLDAENSKKKKNRDKGKVEEYMKEIKNLKNQVEDAKQDIVEELMTTDLKSFASQLASTLMDAFAQGTDEIDAMMKGKIDDLIKSMITKQLAMKVVQQALKPAFDMADRFIAEDSEEGINFSFGEIKQLKAKLEAGIGAISGQGKEWIQMLADLGLVANKDLENRVQEVTGQLREAVTEGTASQLVGLWNMTASDVRVIREWLLTGTAIMPESPFNVTRMIDLQTEIAMNTRVTAQSTMTSMYDLREGFGRLDERLGAIEVNTRGYVGRGR